MKTKLNQTVLKPVLVAGLLAAFLGALLPGAAAQRAETTKVAPANRALALDGQTAFAQVPDAPAFHTISGALTFSDGEYFHGLLDEIRVWKVARW